MALPRGLQPSYLELRASSDPESLVFCPHPNKPRCHLLPCLRACCAVVHSSPATPMCAPPLSLHRTCTDSARALITWTFRKGGQVSLARPVQCFVPQSVTSAKAGTAPSRVCVSAVHPASGAEQVPGECFVGLSGVGTWGEDPAQTECVALVSRALGSSNEARRPRLADADPLGREGKMQLD